MFFNVFRLRSRGHRLAGSDPLIRQSVRGWLQYEPLTHQAFGPPGSHRQALLLSDDKSRELIPSLQRAELRRVSGFLHIVGYEYHSRGRPHKSVPTKYRQSWLCTNNVDTGLDIVSRVRVVVTGFEAYSPELDDDDWP